MRDARRGGWRRQDVLPCPIGALAAAADLSMKPLLKWAGGKRSEIPFLKPHYPNGVQRVIEPFAGGAAVAWDMEDVPAIINDVNGGLVRFYRALADAATAASVQAAIGAIGAKRGAVRAFVRSLDDGAIQQFFGQPETWLAAQRDGLGKGLAGAPWPASMEAAIPGFIDKHVRSKAKRIRRLALAAGDTFDGSRQREHVETALQSALYEALRQVYNGEPEACEGLGEGWVVGAWWAVRALCYSGMFRFGKGGRFNVPYGGGAYNGRDFESASEDLFGAVRAAQMRRFTIENLDFDALFRRYDGFGKGDFVFVDPPYDSSFSQYNVEGDFTQADQVRLRDTLLGCGGDWMLVIKRTAFIEGLYAGQAGLHRHVFDKRYMANFRNRHGREAQHLVITSYPLTLAPESALARL